MSQSQQKPGQPVVGFNHNINYKGRIFHVQTEDSGPQHGHVITHIFMGGNILASTKSSYADLLPLIDPADVSSTVRKLMEDQHKSMMKGLGQGTHDAEIARRTSGNVYEPGVLANGDRAPGLLVGGDKPSSLPPKAAAVTSRPPEPPPVPPPVTPVPPPRAAAMASSLTSRRPLATAPSPAPPVMVPGAISMTSPPRSTASGPGTRNLDDLILAYLAADDGPRRAHG